MGEPVLAPTSLGWALLLARLLLASWFTVELVDKVRRFRFWVSVVGQSGLPAPAAAMGLVVLLLSLGSASLLTGVYVTAGVACLGIFLAPTALLFESREGALKSLSIAGGLLLLAVTGPGPWTLAAWLG